MPAGLLESIGWDASDDEAACDATIHAWTLYSRNYRTNKRCQASVTADWALNEFFWLTRSCSRPSLGIGL
jgi:hypothetical protein